ncbi:MAG: serine/threonine-protein kinase [Isosphaeraceae bacterium]
MSTFEESEDPLDAMGSEFLDRLRRGERPDVSEFTARDPQRADEIREFLEALVLIEGLKPQPDETVDAGIRSVHLQESLTENLGDFHIVRELGRGGMGIVYEAQQQSLGRRVAVKVLAPGISRSSEQIRRFVREARSAARLHHTNIVPVFGVGEHDGLHFYVMQYIAGLGLDKVLEEVRRLKNHAGTATDVPNSSTRPAASDATAVGSRTPPHPASSRRSWLTEPDSAQGQVRPSTLALEADTDRGYFQGVARIGLQVADALDYAHRQGTLHRDVKPSNILLDTHGVAWVTDFGLAKAAEDEDLTHTGDLVGTLRYMAPERFKGQGDARADVYGLGLVLYELLALRPAFGASNREGLLFQVSRVEPQRLRDVNVAIPRDLETIVHKSIEKDAADRYATAGAMADDLRRFLEDQPIFARRLAPTERLLRWARRNPSLASLAAALAGMLALVAVLIVAADLRLRKEHSITLFHLQRAESAETDALSRLLDSSIDHARASRHSHYAGRRAEGLRALGVAARLDTSGARRLELRNEAIACLAIPDLRALKPWPCRIEDGFLGVDFDPATGHLARGTPDGRVEIRTRTGDASVAELSGNGLRAVFLRFSGDGRFLAVKHEARGKLALAVWNVATRTKIVELPDGLYADAVDFHPGGQFFATGRRDGSIVFFDLKTGHELRRLPPGTVPRLIRFDPTGQRIAVASPLAREGAQVRRVSDGTVTASWSFPEPVYAIDWHPDGRQLAVGSQDGRVRLADTGEPANAPRVFEGHNGQVVTLAFHPEGNLLASASWDGTMRLWEARTGLELLKGPLPDARPIRFSRDGRLLGPGHDFDESWLWEVAEGNECRSLVGRQGEGARTWTVDFLEGGQLVVSAGGPGLRLEPIAPRSRNSMLALPGTTDARLFPDGSSLITSGTAGLLRWPIRRSKEEVTLGPPAPLGPLPGVPTGRFAFDREGKTLAVVIDEEVGRILIFDLANPGAPVELRGHPNMERLALSPDARWVATGTWHGTGVKIWDARTGAHVRDLPIAGNAAVVFSPEGRRLLTASGTDYMIWDCATWSALVQIPRTRTSGLPGVAAFSPDGGMLALARTRIEVALVDSATGRELATLEPLDPQNVAGLGFSPDARYLVVTCNASRIEAWDLDALRDGLRPLGLDWPCRRDCERVPARRRAGRREVRGARLARTPEAGRASGAGLALGRGCLVARSGDRLRRAPPRSEDTPNPLSSRAG